MRDTPGWKPPPGWKPLRPLLSLALASSFLILAAVSPTSAPVAAAPAPVPTTTASSSFSDASWGLSDVRGNERYAAAARALAGRAAMLRHYDGSFDPNGTLTRGEMAYFLTRAMGLPESPDHPFLDVAPWDWFAGSVGALYERKLIQGISPRKYLPQRVVTRQEAVALVMRGVAFARRADNAATRLLELTEEQAQMWLGGFRDRLLIDPACSLPVARAYRLGILDSPSDGWFFPAGNLTRAEMAVMLYRAFLQPVASRAAYPLALPAVPKYDSLSVGSKGPLVSALESRLTALRYPCGPVDGVYDHRTRDAVMAFQKVERLKRTGRMSAADWERLTKAAIATPRLSQPGNRCEVDLTRQVLFMVSENNVTKVVHVSTGKLGTRTGHFSIGAKYEGWVKCVTVNGKMYYPSYVVSRTAIHGYESVPPYPASHGCVRVPVWTAKDLYQELPSGTVVDIFY